LRQYSATSFAPGKRPAIPIMAIPSTRFVPVELLISPFLFEIATKKHNGHKTF
jgi:hypothetical protein